MVSLPPNRKVFMFSILKNPAVLFLLCLCAACANAQEKVFYVNSGTGNDATGNGSASAPWQSVQKARDAVRALRKTDGFPKDGVAVELTGTFMCPTETLEFTADDGGESADAPMIYRASADGALFIGGSQLKAEWFTKVEDAETLARLKDCAKGKVFACDLTKAGIPQIEPLPVKFRTWPSVELFANDRAMQIARFPNEGWLEIPNVIDRGVDPVDRTKDEWEFGVRPPVFEYSEDEPARWDVSRGVWLMGFWCMDWYSESLKLASIDKEKKQFTTEVNSLYGVGNRNQWHTAKRRYYAFNLLEELDAPGEWYIDQEKNVLYFYPVDGDLSSVFLSVQKNPIFNIHDAKFFILDGIQAKCSLGLAVYLVRCEDSVIRNVRVYNMTNDGISISGGHRNGLTKSEVFGTGRTCVSLWGGDRKTLEKCENYVTHCHLHHSGRLQRNGGSCLTFNGCGCYIAHSLFHDSPYICVSYGGNEHLFEFNEIHSAMMESGDGGGMYTGRDWGSLGNVVQFNYFHHFGAAGVEWQKSHGLDPDYQPLKESIMVMGVYLDDCDSGDTVQNNVFYKTGWSAFVGGGRYNKILNNLFLDCTCAVHFDDRGLVRAKPGEGFKNGWDLLKKIQDLGFDQSPWKERYPFIQNVMEDDPKLPLHNTVEGNVSIGSVWLQMHNSAQKTSLSRINFRNNYVFAPPTSQKELFPLNEDGSIRAEFREETLQFDDPEKDDFKALQAEVQKYVPDFKPIPVEKIGNR